MPSRTAFGVTEAPSTSLDMLCFVLNLIRCFILSGQGRQFCNKCFSFLVAFLFLYCYSYFFIDE